MMPLLAYAFVGIGLVLVIEGLVYTLFTDSVKKLLDRFHNMPASQLRRGGLVALAAGIVILWLARF